MAFKVSSSRLIKIVRTLEKQANALNTLERLQGNKVVFIETKREAHDLIDELKSAYGLEEFDEWKNKVENQADVKKNR